MRSQGINLFLLLLIQQKKKERARESSSQRGTRTQQNADACTLRLHISLKLSKECVFEIQADRGVRRKKKK